MPSSAPRRSPWYSRRGARVMLVASVAVVGVVLLYALIPPKPSSISYLELQTAGAQAHEALPLLIAIHGRGGSPEEFADAFKSLRVPARIILPRAPDPFEAGGSWYPLNDVLRRPVVIRRRAEELAALIDTIVRTRPTVGLPVLTGFSQGGVMSFALAATYPNRIAAAFPIAATQYLGMPAPTPSAHPPAFHALHGDSDPIMPIDGARAMVATMRASGARASLSDHQHVGHELTKAMVAELLSEIERALGASRQARVEPTSRK